MAKFALPGAEKNRGVIAVAICHDDVELAVAIQVRNRDADRLIPHGQPRLGRREQKKETEVDSHGLLDAGL